MLPGSDEERATFVKANHQNKLLRQQENQGLHLTIKVGSDMRKGCDFDVFAVVTNNTQSVKKCRLVFGSCAVSYNGILGGNCGFKDLLNVELSPGAGEPSLHVVVLKNKLYTFHWEYLTYCNCIASSREESSAKAELHKVWWSAYWGQLNPPGSAAVGLQHQRAIAGTEKHCAGESWNQNQSTYSNT